MKKLLALSAITLLASTGAYAGGSHEGYKAVRADNSNATDMNRNIDDTPQIAITAGQFDAIADDNSAGLLGVEYRFGQMGYKPLGYGLRPVIGANYTTDDSRYAYAGFDWEINLDDAKKWYLIPGLAVGAYAAEDGKDLGGAIEFRDSVEVAYQLDCGHRIGVEFQHMSNAGLYDDNPGAETLMLNYTLPLR